MPFKSEAQRRYLWANEPEIARDWTDTYGSRIHKALGGRIPLANGNFLTGQHFGDEGNRQQLINALEAGLINERQYKIMSGYDARKEMGMTPVQTLQASGIYNTAKGITSPEDFEGRIGPIKSTFLNALGSTGYGFDKDQYEGVLGLNPEAFNRSPTGPYGSNYSAQLAQRSGLAPAYDFDEPSGKIMKVPRNTAADIAAKFYQSDDVTGNFDDYESGFEGFEDADEQAAYDTYASGLPTLKNKFNFPSLNLGNISTGIGTAFSLANDSMPWGFAKRGFDALTSGFNRSTPQQQEAQQKFMNQYNVSTNPQGRMVGGPFAGQNMFGKSAFGSKTAAEQAQRNLDKWGQTASQEKIDEWTKITGGDVQAPKAPTKTVHSGQPTGGHHQGGGGGIGSSASKQGGAPGTTGRSRDWAEGGRIGYLHGGLATLWQK